MAHATGIAAVTALGLSKEQPVRCDRRNGACTPNPAQTPSTQAAVLLYDLFDESFSVLGTAAAAPQNALAAWTNSGLFVDSASRGQLESDATHGPGIPDLKRTLLLHSRSAPGLSNIPRAKGTPADWRVFGASLDDRASAADQLDGQYLFEQIHALEPQKSSNPYESDYYGYGDDYIDENYDRACGGWDINGLTTDLAMMRE